MTPSKAGPWLQVARSPNIQFKDPRKSVLWAARIVRGSKSPTILENNHQTHKERNPLSVSMDLRCLPVVRRTLKFPIKTHKPSNKRNPCAALGLALHWTLSA
jgi:hypothetical protein